MSNEPKCGCTHNKSEHYQRGCCDKCGCTWYHPNEKYIKKQKLKNNDKPNRSPMVYK